MPRRTHVRHDRDNRRHFPSHFEPRAQDDRDPRVLVWFPVTDGRQVMSLDGVPVATVEPHGEEYFDAMTGELARVHTAHIHGERFEGSPTFNNCDAARLHCEAHFARERAA